eukprot:856793-Pelagomonas_calceolata.AAC.1
MLHRLKAYTCRKFLKSLTVNTKSVVVCFDLRTENFPPQALVYDGEALPYSDTSRYLGVIKISTYTKQPRKLSSLAWQAWLTLVLLPINIRFFTASMPTYGFLGHMSSR